MVRELPPTQNLPHHLLHPLRTPFHREPSNPLLCRPRPLTCSMQPLCRKHFSEHLTLRTLCLRTKQKRIALCRMFEFCFRELQVSDTIKKCRSFLSMDEDDGNSSRVVEGVSIRTAPVVAEGYVCDVVVSFMVQSVSLWSCILCVPNTTIYGSCASTLKKVGLAGLGTFNIGTTYGGNDLPGIYV